MSEITEDSLIIPEGPRPRGRPRVEEPLTSISVRVPAELHDRLAKLALHRDEPLSSLVRTLLTLRLK